MAYEKIEWSYSCDYLVRPNSLATEKIQSAPFYEQKSYYIPIEMFRTVHVRFCNTINWTALNLV